MLNSEVSPAQGMTLGRKIYLRATTSLTEATLVQGKAVPLDLEHCVNQFEVTFSWECWPAADLAKVFLLLNITC